MRVPALPGPEGCSPTMRADEVNDQDEGEVCRGPYAGRGYYLMQLLRGGIVTVQGYLTHKKTPYPRTRRPMSRVLWGS